MFEMAVARSFDASDDYSSTRILGTRTPLKAPEAIPAEKNNVYRRRNSFRR